MIEKLPALYLDFLIVLDVPRGSLSWLSCTFCHCRRSSISFPPPAAYLKTILRPLCRCGNWSLCAFSACWKSWVLAWNWSGSEFRTQVQTQNSYTTLVQLVPLQHFPHASWIMHFHVMEMTSFLNLMNQTLLASNFSLAPSSPVIFHIIEDLGKLGTSSGLGFGLKECHGWFDHPVSFVAPPKQLQ